MWFILAKNEKLILGIVIWTTFVGFGHCIHMSPMTCNGSLGVSCPALLYYVPQTPKSIEETIALFRVSSNLVNRTVDGYVIEGACRCVADHNEFSWDVDYMIQRGDTWESISSKFSLLVVKKPDKTLIPTLNVTLDIICGCAESLELLTYRIQSGDTLFTICSRFSCDVDKAAKINNLDDPALIYAGDVMFIPVAVGRKNLIFPLIEDTKSKKDSKLQMYIMVGIVLGAVVIVSLVFFVIWRHYYRRKQTWKLKACIRGIRSFLCDFNALTSGSEESVSLSFHSDKATDFSFNELRDATSNFSPSLMIGQGSYGSVYLGKLRGTDVAIKQMKNTKSKEFFSELNILCTVHHRNLIELIGYAAGESLCLIFEFAQNGALSDHLHNPAVRGFMKEIISRPSTFIGLHIIYSNVLGMKKCFPSSKLSPMPSTVQSLGTGYKPLPWSTRVQIALDAAKGLEYIHVHIRPFYVHRDVKTSNILLDSNFRAKIADFGLVKLLEHSPEMGTTTSRIVGTLGYLAPEYIRDGWVTTKIDVYGFGVVLMELFIGQPALSREATPINAQYSQHRSLVDYVLSVLENDDSLVKLKQCIDPNLSHYHNDSLWQMAWLAKDCVDEDWNRRPDMSQVVQRLSEIHTCSEEWTKTGTVGQNPDVLSLS